MKPFDHPEYKEVICILFQDGIGLFGQQAIDSAQAGHPIRSFHTRGEFRLMTCLDLGDKWAKWADEAPTLFILENLKR